MPARDLPPVYLLAGGPGTLGNPYAGLFRDLLALAGKPKPLVAYLGAASGDNRAFFWMMRRLLEGGGACECALARTASRRADLGETRELLEKSDLVFVSGGDVEAGMRVLEEKKVVAVLQEVRARGTPFFGISAGAIMLGREWVRWRDPDDDSTAQRFGCLGFADVRCDTHGEKDRWGELRALLRLAGEGATGYGIRTNAALKVLGRKVETVAGTVDALKLEAGKVVVA